MEPLTTNPPPPPASRNRPLGHRIAWRGGWPAWTVHLAPHPLRGEPTLAKPNYQFERRQKELARKKKKEEKRRRKLERRQQLESETSPETTEGDEGSEESVRPSGSDTPVS